MRPRIGISTSTLARTPEGSPQPASTVHLAYARCIYHAGGLPLLLPNLVECDDQDEVIRHLDGLLLSGGGDVDPACWGEEPHPALGFVDPVRDRVEIGFLAAARRRDLPVLGICRGVQVMAVAFGGDLWQDIPAQCPHSLAHRQEVPRHQPQHPVRIAEASLLARLLSTAPATAMPELPVNSFHHQAPRHCGPDCTAIAWSPDGIIEALAVPEATFLLGVQWHPEEMAETDPVQARLFSALVAAAGSGYLR